MRMRTFGHPVICYGPEGVAGGGAGDAGTGDAAAAAAAAAAAGGGVVAPWSTAGDKPWAVGDKPWWDTIQEAPVRELMSQKAYKNPAELAMAYHNVNKLVSGSTNVVQVPGADAKPEEWDAFYGKLGRPVDASKYDFTEAFKPYKDKDPNFKPNERLDKFARDFAFKHGLTNTQALSVVADYAKMEGEMHAEVATSSQAANEAAMTELAKTWGADLEKNRAAGQRVVTALKLPDELMAGPREAHGRCAACGLARAYRPCVGRRRVQDGRQRRKSIPTR
jgi:hypothetical protein